jgi:hypothetical protein
MRDEVMKCEDVKQFFTLLRQFDTDRRGTTDLAPAVATLADYFAASPVAGASFDEDFHRQVTESLAVLQQGLRDTESTDRSDAQARERAAGQAQRVAEALGTRATTVSVQALQVAVSILNSPISVGEFQSIMKTRVKRGKAPGPDGIPAECYAKVDGLAKTIVTVFNAVMTEGHYPDAWRTALIVPLLKSWRLDPAEKAHYRPISLQQTLAKIFAAILERRLASFFATVKAVCPAQFGFIAQRQATDAVFILSTLIQEAQSHKSDMYVAFIDFSKAYDSVDRSSLQVKLLLEGVRGPVYDVLHSMYAAMRSSVALGNKVSSPFDQLIGRGKGQLAVVRR